MTTANLLSRLRTLLDEASAGFWTDVECYAALSDGQKEIVNDWIGAEGIYGEFVYKNINDIRRLLAEDYKPEKYRKFVEENYNLDKIYPKLEELFELEVKV